MSKSLVQRAVSVAIFLARGELLAWSTGNLTINYFNAKRNLKQLLRMRDDMADGSMMPAAAFNRLDDYYKDAIDEFVQDNGIHPKEVFG